MLELSITLPKGTTDKREENMLILQVDDDQASTSLLLAQMNLWLRINGETTDTASLGINHDEEFEVHIDSQNEHLSEGEELISYTPAPPEFEYGKLSLIHGENSIPMFTFNATDINIKEIGSELVSILNRLGKHGWELTHRESENNYIMKRERV